MGASFAWEGLKTAQTYREPPSIVFSLPSHIVAQVLISCPVEEHLCRRAGTRLADFCQPARPARKRVEPDFTIGCSPSFAKRPAHLVMPCTMPHTACCISDCSSRSHAPLPTLPARPDCTSALVPALLTCAFRYDACMRACGHAGMRAYLCACLRVGGWACGCMGVRAGGQSGRWGMCSCMHTDGRIDACGVAIFCHAQACMPHVYR